MNFATAPSTDYPGFSTPQQLWVGTDPGVFSNAAGVVPVLPASSQGSLCAAYAYLSWVLDDAVLAQERAMPSAWLRSQGQPISSRLARFGLVSPYSVPSAALVKWAESDFATLNSFDTSSVFPLVDVPFRHGGLVRPGAAGKVNLLAPTSTIEVDMAVPLASARSTNNVEAIHSLGVDELVSLTGESRQVIRAWLDWKGDVYARRGSASLLSNSFQPFGPINSQSLNQRFVNWMDNKIDSYMPAACSVMPTKFSDHFDLTDLFLAPGPDPNHATILGKVQARSRPNFAIPVPKPLSWTIDA
ncbi:hypothetical protein [Mollivirus kamchatka]|nr:hypothetical protein [Mollivirus kamchatka]